jgi:hypothetical protein
MRESSQQPPPESAPLTGRHHNAENDSEFRNVSERHYVTVKSRIMYIENKADGLTGPARIGREWNVTARHPEAPGYARARTSDSRSLAT